MQDSRQPQLQSTAAASADIGAILLIVTVTWLLFGRIVGDCFLTNWDDPRYIVQNEVIRGFTLQHLKSAFTSFYVGNYAPLHIISYMLDYTLWGLDPRGFAAGNIMLHAFNGALLFTIFRFLGAALLPALCGALLFVLHPVQVESVAWLSQRKNLLAMFFSLIALLFYLRWRGTRESRSGGTYVISLSAFIAALLAKSAAVVLPPMLLLYEFSRRSPVRLQKVLRPLIPYVAATALVALLAMISQSPEAGGGRVAYHGGSLWSTALTMFPVLLMYVRMLFWPLALSAVYDPPVKSSVDLAVFAGAALLLLLLAVAIWLYRSRRELFFWYAAIFIALLPVSQIVPLVTLMNDRYLYFPMIGIAGVVCFSADRLDFKGNDYLRMAAIALSALVLSLLTVVSLKRIPVWHDSLTLWGDAVLKAPGSHTAWYGLAEAEHGAGRLEAARFAYLRSLSIKPDSVETVENLGVLLIDMGDSATARSLLVPLLKGGSGDLSPLLNIGESYLAEGDIASAERNFASALALQPASAKPLAALGGVWMLKGDTARSKDYFTRAEAAGLSRDRLALYRASLLSRYGRAGEALAELRSAVKLGYSDFAPLAWDRYFDNIRALPEFRAITNIRKEGGGR